MTVNRIGYGAMQLTGPGVWGPPKDVDAAVAVLRVAVRSGVNHIDTADFYGPHITNELIRKALHPYPSDLVIVTKVGAGRRADGSVVPAVAHHELIDAVHDNLRTLGLETLDVVNYRVMAAPGEPPIAEQIGLLAELQSAGLIRYLGVSNVTAAQVAEAQAEADILCVQNRYNVAEREDDRLIDDLARKGIAYVPFWPLGGMSPLRSATLATIASRFGVTPFLVAQAWLLHRSSNILLIPGTSSVAHLRENLAAGSLTLSVEDVVALDKIAPDLR
jgi:aryl-alcohol dehydrogenase-like predicted oxidoreductase